MFLPIAQDGNAVAQYYLGMMYGIGIGPERDTDISLKWLRLAAENGYAPSQRMVGISYLRGEWGVSQDLKQGKHWLTLAANQNDAVAQHRIGQMYLEGIFVPKNLKVGIEWIKRAAELGDSDAQFDLANHNVEG